MGYGYRLIHGKVLRHAYSIILGVMLHIFMFRISAVHFYILSALVTLAMAVWPREKQGLYVFALSMGYLSCSHLYRMFTDYGGWSMDSTTFLMPLVCRLSSVGFCFADGAKEEKELLSEEQKERKLEQRPHLIEMISYACFPAANV